MTEFCSLFTFDMGYTPNTTKAHFLFGIQGSLLEVLRGPYLVLATQVGSVRRKSYPTCCTMSRFIEALDDLEILGSGDAIFEPAQ